MLHNKNKISNIQYCNCIFFEKNIMFQIKYKMIYTHLTQNTNFIIFKSILIN